MWGFRSRGIGRLHTVGQRREIAGLETRGAFIFGVLGVNAVFRSVWLNARNMETVDGIMDWRLRWTVGS